MKLWTVQHNNVIDIINTNGVYYPDFSKSTYAVKKDYSGIYTSLLTSYNKINNQSNKGLVFCFAPENPETSVRDYFTERSFTLDNLRCFHNDFWNHTILELDTHTPDNLLKIDYKDWELLLPSNDDKDSEEAYIDFFGSLNRYNKFIKNVHESLQSGKLHEPSISFLTSMPQVIQAHIPCLRKTDIVKSNPCFRL
jgi:hypothetical protein